MSIVRGVKDRRFKFVQLLNCMFEDQNLSLKAKGFIGYCLTKPPEWKFHVNHLCAVLKEGEKAIYSVIKECIEHGYAYRYQSRNSNGDFLPVEIIVSDSKEEIAEIKKEIESDATFKKFLPLPPFGDAIDSGAEEVSSSNTNISNTQEQQQQAAVFTSKKPLKTQPEKKISKITQHNINYQKLNSKEIEITKTKTYLILENLNIPETDKIEITNKYEESIVANAIEWSKHQKEFRKGLAAALKFACANKIKWEEPKPSKSIYESLCEKFENGKCYLGAECILNKNVIAFQRGMTYFEMKLDKYFSWQKFKEMGENLRIKYT